MTGAFIKPMEIQWSKFGMAEKFVTDLVALALVSNVSGNNAAEHI